MSDWQPPLAQPVFEMPLSSRRWASLLAAACPLFMLIVNPARSNPIFALLFVAYAAGTLYIYWPMWQQIRLFPDALVVPQHGPSLRIPVELIAGVGMSYVKVARRWVWRTTIWDSNGLGVNMLGSSSVPEGGPPSDGARQTRALWEAVLRLQGTDGPLSTLALQHNALRSWATAVWCPDTGKTYEPRDITAETG